MEKLFLKQMAKRTSSSLSVEAKLQKLGRIEHSSDLRTKKFMPTVEKIGIRHVVHDIPVEMSEAELRVYFSKLFLNHPHAVLEISPKLGEEARRSILALVQKNYPMVEIIRLIPDHQVVNILILGNKSLNDKYSMEFTDRVRSAL